MMVNSYGNPTPKKKAGNWMVLRDLEAYVAAGGSNVVGSRIG